MPYKVERLPNEPIIVVTWQSPTDPGEDADKMCEEVDACIKPDETKVYCINDFREVKINFSALVSGMAVQRQNRPGAAGDPRIRSIMIGSGTLWDLASKAAKQLQYGGLDMPLFATLDDAIAHAREKIKTW